ncbi:MAG: hypothetical protein HC920_12290 [Oscillatoriales cyanobacterium SM2_3_0]|nr:hypothetical protein [Oscillatoriales cyanobacterium SM2_3_0]
MLIEKHYEELPQIECSPGQINQVLINILNNSIDALDQAFSHFNAAPRVDDPEKESHPISAVPTIKIWTKVIDPDRIGIWISDNGTGMNLEVRERLFDPFFTTKPVGSGTGLGLSISYEIVVNQHQGTLACNSELGQGTEFMVVLPIEQPKANATLDLNRESSL